jgi:DNA-binding MarR family transcriptional regulator
MDRHTTLPEEDVRKLEKLLRAVEVFRELETSLPLSYVAAFLNVAISPDKGVSEYARDLGVAQPVASRVLLEIGKKARYGGEGLGLIDQDFAPNDLRTKHAYLTPKGVKLVRKLTLALGRDI